MAILRNESNINRFEMDPGATLTPPEGVSDSSNNDVGSGSETTDASRTGIGDVCSNASTVVGAVLTSSSKCDDATTSGTGKDPNTEEGS